MPLPQQWIQAFPASPRSSNKTKCGAPPQTYLARLRSRGKGRSRQMGDGAAGSSGLWRGDRAELKEQSEVVSGRPVFRDQGIGDPKDVDVLHGVRLSRGRRRDQCRALNTDPTVWQRIRRTVRSDPKRAADGYSADDEVIFRDEVINLPAAVGKGSPKGPEDPPDSIPATRLLRSVLSSSPASPAPARARSSTGRFPPMRAWSRSTKARFTAHDGATRPRTPVCSTRSATRLRRPIA